MPLHRPNRISSIECILVQGLWATHATALVGTESGISGIGEAGLMRRPLAVSGAIAHLERFLLGQDANQIERLWQEMFRGGVFPADRVVGSAVAAIDTALWDIKAKGLGVPIYELLGGRTRDYIECYHPIPRGRIDHVFGSAAYADAMVAEGRAAVADGWRYLRFSPPDVNGVVDPRLAMNDLIDLVAILRESLGRDVELIVDVHTRLEPPDAVTFCRAVEQFRPYYIEDPLRSEFQEGYRRLRSQTSVPIAAGELLESKWAFRSLIEEDLVDFARVDVCVAGGLTEAHKIAGWAEVHNIRVVPHNPLGPVSTAAAAHLAFGATNVTLLEISPAASALDDVFPTQFTVRDGRIAPSDAPGLGVSIDLVQAKAHAFAFTEPPHFRRPDGSYTNA